MVAGLDQLDGDVLGAQSLGEAQRRLPRHVRVALAVQQMHRAADRDRAAQLEASQTAPPPDAGIVEAAVVPTRPAYPRKALIYVFALGSGLLLGGLLALALATTATPDLRALNVNELMAAPTKNRAAPTVTIIRGGARSTETVRGG